MISKQEISRLFLREALQLPTVSSLAYYVLSLFMPRWLICHHLQGFAPMGIETLSDTR